MECRSERAGNDSSISPKTALKFVVLLGIVSLFADMTYEGSRSVTGPYLSVLGANAAAVGVVAGLGEFIGYGLRLVFGYVSDRTGKYWTLTLAGYGLNLLAVPLLALAGRWEVAAILIVLERMGKAVRSPARDTILSHATGRIGRGFGFGLHEALDQVGAVAGPLIIAGVLYFQGDYRTGFVILLVPALLAMGALTAARLIYPNPRDFDLTGGPSGLKTKGFGRTFRLYLVAVALIAAGFADFPLIAYHFNKTAVVPQNWIPVFYAIAMGVDALSALFFGRLFDRIGFTTLIGVSLLSSFFALFVFGGGGTYLVLAGMVLWGIGIGAQESIMRAVVPSMVPVDKRGTAYGVLNAGYGLFWFLGSALMGVLYEVSIPYVIAFSVSIQLASVLVLFFVRKSV